MIINHDRRFIFFHVPKVAGSSIRSALLTLPGSLDILQGQKHQTPAQFSARQGRGIILSLRYRFYFTFCFVRDPWERFGSLHRYATVRRRAWVEIFGDVNDFALALKEQAPWLMKRRSIRPQSDYARNLSLVGKFERIEEDFARIVARIGCSGLALPRLNPSGPLTCYRDTMNARSQAIIAEFYREDIERFGYR